jgi:hypothetical protein
MNFVDREILVVPISQNSQSVEIEYVEKTATNALADKCVWSVVSGFIYDSIARVGNITPSLRPTT